MDWRGIIRARTAAFITVEKSAKIVDTVGSAYSS